MKIETMNCETIILFLKMTVSQLKREGEGGRRRGAGVQCSAAGKQGGEEEKKTTCRHKRKTRHAKGKRTNNR
jgi:hypothetical protein